MEGRPGSHTWNTSWNDDDICTSQSLLLGLFRLWLFALEITLGGNLAINDLQIVRFGCEDYLSGEGKGREEVRTAGEAMCDRSAATPGVLTTSNRDSSSTRGEIFKSNDNGCDRGQQTSRSKSSVCRLTWPMPPAAPRTTALTIVIDGEG